MADASPQASDGPDSGGPDRLDRSVVECLRHLSTDVPTTVSPERLEMLDRAVMDAVDGVGDSRMTQDAPSVFRIPSAARWMGRAAAILLAAIVGGRLGWQPPSHPTTLGDGAIVAAEGPITVLDAFAVARLLAQSSTKTIDARVLGPAVSARLDLDGDGRLDDGDLQRLIEIALANRTPASEGAEP